MKRRILPVLALLFMLSLSTCFVLARKPSKTALDVTILSPQDGLKVEYDEILEICGTFLVTGTVQAKRGDAGFVQTFVQYALGEGSTDFNDAGDTNLQIVSGGQPQTSTLAKDQSDEVSWILTGSPGTYEIRIFSQGSTAKSGESDSRTVTLLGPPPDPPPDDYETIDWEYQDPETGFGTASGTHENTYYADGVYEILSEGINKQDTKKPVDDTAEMGWIYVFNNLDFREHTSLYFYGHTDCSAELFGVDAYADSDSAFFIQVKTSNEWMTIGSITRHDVTDEMYCWDIGDDSLSILEIRIIDNDETIGNTKISSLYVDQVFIVYEPAEEYIIADLPSNVGRRALRTGDIDGDDMNEVVVGLQELTENPLRYYKYVGGFWSEHSIPVSSSETGSNMHGIISLEVGYVDNDTQNEILVGMHHGSGESDLRYYDYEMNTWMEKHIASPDVGVLSVAMGDLDNDNAIEVAVGLGCSDIGSGYELRYYEQQSGVWIEADIADFGSSTDGTGNVECVKVGDVDHDNLNELVCMVAIPNYQEDSALKYYKLDSGVWVKHDIPNVPFGWEIDIGDVDNDNKTEIAWGNYAQDTNEVRVYDYDESTSIWVEHIVSDVPGGCVNTATYVHHVAIGDVDNDGLNELAIGLFDDGWRGLSNEAVRYYKLIAGVWSEYNVTDPDLTAEVVQIADVDSDGQNELLVCLVSWYSYSTQVPELRYFKIG
jgi:hypothetical protein